MGSMLRLAPALPWLFPMAALATPEKPSGTQGTSSLTHLQLLVLDLSTGLLLLAALIIGAAIILSRGTNRSGARRADWSWMIVPLLLLGINLAIARHSSEATVPPIAGAGSALEVKVTAHQGWWEYEYRGSGVRLATLSDPRGGGRSEIRLVLPMGRTVRLLQTAADNVQLFSVPGLGIHTDAMPGYVTESRIMVEREGLYRGACDGCAARSPRQVVVEVVDEERFDAWLASQQSANGMRRGG